ncbi:MAG: type II toxin-antitoxin system VapC family toxin [Elainellaceae cyanobacterium]
MKTVFADTGYWVAILNPDDGLHQVSVSVTATLSALRIITSEMVLTEVLNSFSKQGAFLRQNAVMLIQRSMRQSNVEIVPQTSELFHEALQLYTQRPDQAWSLTDCASFCIMQQRNILEALTHDRHFEQAGFIALLR